MFSKTRRKIVYTVVFSLLALMMITLATIYVSNRAALQRENEEMLKTFTERFFLENQAPDEGEEKRNEKPDNRRAEDKPVPRNGEPGKNEPRFQLSTFYAVLYSEDGEVLSVESENRALQSEETLIETSQTILQSGKTSGRCGNMTYLVERRDDKTLVAMIDATINNGNQSLLFRQMLVIGSAAMILLAILSVFLAFRIVKPLEENDKRQKRFVSDAGHELKTPIAVVSANSELLRREVGDREWLDNIDYENERMNDLVKQLLILSKAENGEFPKETLDFSKLIDGEALPFESLAFEKGVRIESKIEPNLKVSGNPIRLKQLVSILLDNALSHGTGDTIELTLKRERHNAVLTVSNQAEEISADQLPRLFDRFFRTDEARGESGAHYGLGLSIAKAVAEAHGGGIEAAYKENKAIFTVFIPIEK